jgi:hypothetical protein
MGNVPSLFGEYENRFAMCKSHTVSRKGFKSRQPKTKTMITKANIKDVSLSADPSSVNFCQAWPAAKAGLEILEKIVKNPFLKGTIEMLIKLGDGLCPGSAVAPEQ